MLFTPGYLRVEDKDFRLEKQIAKGGAGLVYLGSPVSDDLKSFGKKIIIKIMADNYDQLNEKQKQLFDQEIAIMTAMKGSEYVANIIAYCHQPCCLIMKFYPYGSLYKIIHKPSKFKTYRIDYLIILRHVAKAIDALYRRDIAHLDVKSENILVEKGRNDLRGLLTDFGISHILSTKLLCQSVCTSHKPRSKYELL